MTVQPLPWAIQGSSHEAAIARNALAATFGVPVAAHTVAASVTTAGGGHGVVLAGDMAVAQNGTPNMSVNVAAGRALIRSGGTSSLLAAVYAVLNDATVNVSISAADATNPRRDLIIAQVRDTNYGEAASDARITVVTGTPAASPSDPSLTSYPNALVLARVAVAAGVTTITDANITDLRTRVTAVGGRVVCSSTGRPTGDSLYEGLQIAEINTDRLWTYSGAAWRFEGHYSSAGRPGVVLTDAAQNVTTASATDITWGTEVSDVDGWLSGGSATLTVPTDWGGQYTVTYSGTWSSNALGTTPGVQALVNGTVAKFAGGLSVPGVHTLSFSRVLSAGDTLKFQAYQNSGGTLTITSRLEIAWLGH